MRSGRPSYHVKARWISCVDPETKTVEYYQLDQKGHLIKNEGMIKPSKTERFNSSHSHDPPDIIEPVVKASAESLVSIQNEEVVNSVEDFPFFDDELENELFVLDNRVCGDLLEF